MVVLPSVSLAGLEIILAVLLGILALIGGLGLSLWYWGLDHQTEVYDSKLREDIQEDPAFSGIRSVARTKLVATSDSRFSKITTLIKTRAGRLANKPDKIVVVDGDTVEERQIEIIRERVRDIPGKNILPNDLYVALKNHYAYKLALSEEEIRSEAIQHFQSRFEGYEQSEKIHELSRPSNYENVCLIPNSNNEGEKDPLNNVFLPLVEAAERHCVRPISSVNAKIDEIERCRECLMVAFFVLWTQRLQGIEVSPQLSEGECLSAYRVDIRDEDNWGYWLLPNGKCDEEEFERLRHMAWRITHTIDEYWTSGNYSSLYPIGDSLVDIEPVERPFLLTLKDESEFRGGSRAGGG